MYETKRVHLKLSAIEKPTDPVKVAWRLIIKDKSIKLSLDPICPVTSPPLALTLRDLDEIVAEVLL